MKRLSLTILKELSQTNANLIAVGVHSIIDLNTIL